MRRLLLLGVTLAIAAFVCLLVGLSLLAAEASAGTVVATPGPWQGYVDASRVPTPPVELEVVVDAAACPGGLGCSVPGSRVIDLSPYAGRSTFLHELGHEFDFTVLTPGERERFAALLGPERQAMPWWSADESMGEWFADTYMQCARLPRIDPRWSYTVSNGLLAGWRLRRECGLIRYAAAVAS